MPTHDTTRRATKQERRYETSLTKKSASRCLRARRELAAVLKLRLHACGGGGGGGGGGGEDDVAEEDVVAVEALDADGGDAAAAAAAAVDDDDRPPTPPRDDDIVDGVPLDEDDGACGTSQDTRSTASAAGRRSVRPSSALARRAARVGASHQHRLLHRLAFDADLAQLRERRALRQQDCTRANAARRTDAATAGGNGRIRVGADKRQPSAHGAPRRRRRSHL